MNESTIQEIIEAAKDEIGEAGISKWNDGFIAGAEFGAAWYEDKLTMKIPSEEHSQPFEQYPELAELILYAATNWKVNYKWSETLGAINKVCAELTELRNSLQCNIYKK